MIANLPLLFANGNPTALCKISTSELERFITFMVTCSWGHDTAKDIRKPPWWPDDVSFSHPFTRPKLAPKDWDIKLKQIVRKCYEYHKSAFLLIFSAKLSRYPRNRLKYVDNLDHTTSLYYRPSGKLLVTFRNENLYYDKYPSTTHVEQQLNSTDIYLCDNCDSHFDNLELLKVHERLCNPEYQGSSSTSVGGLNEFLSALKLQHAGAKNDNQTSNVVEARTRQIRSAANIDRGPPYPFSSLAYMRNAKSNNNRDNTFSRERIERYCCTSTILPNKSVTVSRSRGQFPIRYRRPIDFWHRRHVFPWQRNKQILDLKGQLYLLKCRPVTVQLERMSLESIQTYIDNLKALALLKKDSALDKDIEFVAESVCDQVVDAGSQKTVDPLNRDADNIWDDVIIDLCSDEESPSNENCDPRAGITCVMRGGAVLRRTAATPQTQPAEPCGARQRPLQNAVLQTHPIVVYTQSLANIKTISID